MFTTVKSRKIFSVYKQSMPYFNKLDVTDNE